MRLGRGMSSPAKLNAKNLESDSHIPVSTKAEPSSSGKDKDNVSDATQLKRKEISDISSNKRKKKKRRKRKRIPNFIPWRKLIAKAVENGGPKGLTRKALRTEIVVKDGKEDQRLSEEFDFQLDKALNQGKLVCQDGNKIKLTKSLDERAKVRILEEIKQRKEETEKKQREAELEYYNKLSY